MKRLTILILCLVLLISSAQATIIPSAGEREDIGVWTGYTPAVILCQSLSVYDARGDQGGKKVATLKYSTSGSPIAVLQSWDGWAEVGYADGNKTGWVHNEYLLMNPDWYVCDQGTRVYAWDDTMSPCVAYLDKGTKLAIIRDLGDWVQVSLRGATGYIKKTAKDQVQDFWFKPAMLNDLVSATLTFGEGKGVNVFDPNVISRLIPLLVNAEPMLGSSACPFTATLTVVLEDGEHFDMQLATDSCCAYIVDGVTYAYARHLKVADSGVDNNVLFNLFGLTTGN